MAIQLTEKRIKGKKIRTNNHRLDEIIALWNKVPEMRLEGGFFAVYSNYESNFKGDYDLLIGNEQADFSDSSIIHAGEYVEIVVTEATPKGVGETWQKIWGDEALEKRRSYLSDVEQYNADGTITIYLSV
ncbi:GyrI-like domain-containing protein [Enterococcus sp. AZ126]|uniref:GyrI-like domain-containing protein n=1 Tax=Enterococcus sp. AZ126 TaxID=2774635 RepID=UPI003F21734A